MTIHTVLYINEDNVETLNLNDLLAKENYNFVKKNLFCTFEGCNARIEFVPQGKRIAHFKTWPKSNHTVDCIDYFMREEKASSKYSRETTTIGLSDKRIAEILKAFSKSIDETEEARAQRLENQRNRNKNKKNVTVNPAVDQKEVDRIIPSTSDEADIIGEGTRAPVVKRRHNINDISEADVGTATAVTGNVIDVFIEHDRSIITLSKNNSLFKVYLDEVFFVNSHSNVIEMLKKLKDISANEKTIRLECVGNIEKRNNQLCVSLTNQEHLRLNGLRIARFIFNYNNPQLF